MHRLLFIIGAAAGFESIIAGTFAAHWLDSRLDERMLEVFEVGARYEMYHGLAILAAAIAYGLGGGRWAAKAGWFFTAGIIFFSGSLYLLALTNARWLGMIAPLGGVCFLIGWAMMIAAAIWPDRDASLRESRDGG